MNKQRGFTLVELLVVIAIVAVLAGAVMLAINPIAQIQKANDARRFSDLDTIQSALRLALLDGEVQLAVAGPTTSLAGTQVVTGGGYVSFTVPTGKTGLVKYIPTLPVDSVNSGVYVYTFQSNLTDYELNATLEYPGNANKMTTDGGNAPLKYEVGTSLTLMGL